MAKQYQLFFDEEVTEKIEKIAVESGFRSGRQWLIEKIYKAIDQYETAMKTFEMPEFVFLMKDGSFKQGKGATAGGAWRALGFTTEEAPEKMDSYKTLADARAAGWVASPESTPGIVAPTPPALEKQKASAVVGPPVEATITLAPQSEAEADDLPFGS